MWPMPGSGVLMRQDGKPHLIIRKSQPSKRYIGVDFDRGLIELGCESGMCKNVFLTQDAIWT